MVEQEQVLSRGRRLDCGHIAASKARVHEVEGRWLCFPCAIDKHVDTFTNHHNITVAGLMDAGFVRHISTYPAPQAWVQPPPSRWRAFVDYLVGA